MPLASLETARPWFSDHSISALLSSVWFFFVVAPELTFVLCVQHKANNCTAKSRVLFSLRQVGPLHCTTSTVDGVYEAIAQSKENWKIHCSKSYWARPSGINFHCATAPEEATIMSCT